jgi:serine/threonine protein kinase
MEYAETQSLHTFLKSKPNRRLDENIAKDLFKQVVDGIDYLHKRNIVHRDIKLENLMLTAENQVKIIDFGFSVKIPKDKTLGVFCGTPSYMSPELATKRDYYGHLADIWALGILLYVLLVGAFPIKGISFPKK